MKITKEKLNQIIQEELAALAEEDAEIAAALMGPAGLPRSAQNTKPDRPDPERETIDVGDAAPKDRAISAAEDALEPLKWNKGTKSDDFVIYQVAMYLQNIGGDEIDAVVNQSREQAKYMGLDDQLEEGYEHEGSMARSQLGRTAELATMIQGMISDDTNLEEWVESKITKAQDYLSSVLNYMRGESLSEAQYEGDEPEKNYALEKIQDGLLYFVRGYDFNKDMEIKVRDKFIPEFIEKVRAAMEDAMEDAMEEKQKK